MWVPANYARMATAQPIENKMYDYLLKTQFTGKTIIVKWSDLINFFSLKRGEFRHRPYWTSILIYLHEINIIKITKSCENSKLVIFKIVLYGLEIEF